MVGGRGPVEKFMIGFFNEWGCGKGMEMGGVLVFF